MHTFFNKFLHIIQNMLPILSLFIFLLITLAIPSNTFETDQQEITQHIIRLIPLIYALQIVIFQKQLHTFTKQVTLLLSSNVLFIATITKIFNLFPIPADILSYFTYWSYAGLAYVLLANKLWFQIILILTKRVLSMRVHNEAIQHIVKRDDVPANIRKLIVSRNIVAYASCILICMTTYGIITENRFYILSVLLLIGINIKTLLPRKSYPRSYNILHKEFLVIQNKYVKTTLVALTLLAVFYLFSHPQSRNYYHDEVIQYQALLGYERHGEFARYDPTSDAFIQTYPRANMLTRLSVFSRSILGDSVGATRLPVMIFALLTFVGVLSVGYIINPFVGAVAGYLLLTQPIFLYLGGFFRDYAGLMFFTFTFLVSLVKLLETFTEKKNSIFQQIFLTITLLLSLILAYDSGPQIWIVFGTVPFALTYVGIITRNNRLLQAMVGLIFVALVVIILDFLGIVRFLYIQHMVTTQLTTAINFNKAHLYAQYLSGQKYWLLSGILFFWGFVYAFIRKNILVVTFCIATMLSFVVIGFFGNRYEDFRYISFIIPAYTVSIAFAYTAFFTEHFARSKSTTIKPILLITLGICILFTFKIPNPLLNNNRFYKVPVFWEENDGLLLHRRAVAHEYAPVIKYLRTHADADDILVYGGEFDIKTTLLTLFYPSRSNNLGYSPVTAENGEIRYTSIESLIQSKSKTDSVVYVMLSYPHLNGKKDLAYLQHNCANLGTTLKLLKYAYTDEYRTMPNASWPTFYQCVQ